MATTSWIGSAVDEYALDDIVESYVDWREQARSVWVAYASWDTAPETEARLRFAAYLAELDQEQRTCEVHAATVARTVARHAHAP
jgi:hypothetical protein